MSERDSRGVAHWVGGRLHLLRSESHCRKACLLGLVVAVVGCGERWGRD